MYGLRMDKKVRDAKTPFYKRFFRRCIFVQVLLSAALLEPGGIDHPESTRNNQSELIRKSQCTYMAN